MSSCQVPSAVSFFFITDIITVPLKVKYLEKNRSAVEALPPPLWHSFELPLLDLAQRNHANDHQMRLETEWAAECNYITGF